MELLVPAKKGIMLGVHSIEIHYSAGFAKMI